MIGLSGLITPSLDEMVFVAAEMERQNIHLPLLIGGATTSPAHTAVKIDPAFPSAPVIHVSDASRAVGVVSAMMNPADRETMWGTTKARYDRIRESRAGGPPTPRLPIAEAREKAFNTEAASAPPPGFTGVKTFDEVDLSELSRYIDWTPYFMSWDLAGRYPQILEDEKVGEAASDLWRDTQVMLQRLLGEGWFKPKGVVGFWEATRQGDDIRLSTGDTLHTLRQQMVKNNEKPNFALSDFISPKGDHIGAFCVTSGNEADTISKDFKEKGDDYSAIMVQALADRFAEAMAEYMHEKVRKDLWGYAPDEAFDNEALVKEKYRGIRPAPGYPAQPDHTEKELIFRLLEAEERIGVSLTTSFAMSPAPSVSGLYFAHPESVYFAVGRIERDQVEDYAKRKGWDVRTCERWLAPILNYDPFAVSTDEAA